MVKWKERRKGAAEPPPGRYDRRREEWGRYDGTEHAVLKVSPALLDELYWPDYEINKPVAYRLD